MYKKLKKNPPNDHLEQSQVLKNDSKIKQILILEIRVDVCKMLILISFTVVFQYF